MWPSGDREKNSWPIWTLKHLSSMYGIGVFRTKLQQSLFPVSSKPCIDIVHECNKECSKRTRLVFWPFSIQLHLREQILQQLTERTKGGELKLMLEHYRRHLIMFLGQTAISS